MNAAAMDRITILSKGQVQKLVDMGPGFLAMLMNAVRNIVRAVGMPFKAIARLLFKPKDGAVQEDAKLTPPDFPPGVHPESPEADVSALDGLQSPSAQSELIESVASEEVTQAVTESPVEPALFVELSGLPSEVAKLKEALLTYLKPLIDNPESFVVNVSSKESAQNAMFALGEEAENIRFAHKICAKQIALISSDAATKKCRYNGISAPSIVEYVRRTRATRQTAEFYGEDSHEAKLANLLDLEDQLRTSFNRCVLSASSLAFGSAEIAPQLLDHFLRASSEADTKLRAAEIAAVATSNDTPKGQYVSLKEEAYRPFMLPEVKETLDSMMNSVSNIATTVSSQGHSSHSHEAADAPVAQNNENGNSPEKNVIPSSAPEPELKATPQPVQTGAVDTELSFKERLLKDALDEVAIDEEDNERMVQ